MHVHLPFHLTNDKPLMPSTPFLNKNLLLLIACQGLFLTNNVTFIAINGLVGLGLTPIAWMATLPVMGYVVGSALSTSLVSKAQSRFGRRKSFQLGLIVAICSSLICAYAAWTKNFWLLSTGTLVAGFYSANAQLYRFAATELTADVHKEKAVSWPQFGDLDEKYSFCSFCGCLFGIDLGRTHGHCADAIHRLSH